MDAYTRSSGSDWSFRLGVGEAGAWKDIPCAPGSLKALLVKAGAAILVEGGRRSLIESPACLCLSDRGDARVEGEEGCRYLAAVFDPAIINRAFGERDVLKEELFSGDEKFDRFYLEPFLGGGPCVPGLYPLDPAELSPEPAAPDMEKVALHIHVHFPEKLTIAGLASAFGTNRTTLMARFKRYAGVTINEYLVGLRVRMAGVLLRDSCIPIGEIAYRAGFKDLTHFGKTFRKRTGETPTEYRARLNWILKSAS